MRHGLPPSWRVLSTEESLSILRGVEANQASTASAMQQVGTHTLDYFGWLSMIHLIVSGLSHTQLLNLSCNNLSAKPSCVQPAAKRPSLGSSKQKLTTLCFISGGQRCVGGLFCTSASCCGIPYLRCSCLSDLVPLSEISLHTHVPVDQVV